MLSRLERYYPVSLNFLPTCILLTVILFDIAHFKSLPPQIPVHFGLNGEADGFAAKTYLSLFTLPLMGILVCGGLTMLNVFLIMKPENPASVMNITGQARLKLGMEGMEELRTYMARALCSLNIIIALMLSYLSYNIVQISLNERQSLGWLVWIFLLLIVGISISLVVKTARLTSSAQKTGNGRLE